ncbi:type VII secretion protein EccB [Streptacidiphilus sp. N1-3]|uniref:Type VII secretion protein EccB n=1 Tax=Streptacidiphilus alkalitolerans TaxID=3342712 RepID=A0ABV6XED4_9ACTN
MASRRNELSAYTFSRRRTVAAFLQPSGGGNEEDVPKPRRAFMPSLIAGAVAVAGFGAYGMIKPSAPLHWDQANAVIVDKQTTTRYVMLGGQLHPVLNIASARLLLGVDSTVEEVDDSVLNSGSVPHGPTLGIPYAPDSLPTAKDAATPKTWAECDRPAASGQSGTDQKLFVLGGADAAKVTTAAVAPTPTPGAPQSADGRPAGGPVGSREALYVEAPSGLYLVDSTGTAHQLVSDGSQPSALDGYGAAVGAAPTHKASNTPSGTHTTPSSSTTGKPVTPSSPAAPVTKAAPAKDPATTAAAELLATAAFGGNVGLPQTVTKEWLDTLRPGDPISLPKGEMADFGDPTPITLDNIRFNVGDLFQETDNSGQVRHYVVLKDGIHKVSDFTDRLIVALHKNKSPEPKVDPLAAVGANNSAAFLADKDWPQNLVSQANVGAANGSGPAVACSVYTGATGETGAPVQALWTGSDYPIDSNSGSAGVYVTPGTGLLYRAVTGTSTTSGSVDLLTDTGLRYPVQMNADTTAAPTTPAADPSAAPSDGASAAAGGQPNTTQALLGYQTVDPIPVVPESWSGLLPTGPGLNPGAAVQQQGS